jgi:hypothetical protein
VIKARSICVALLGLAFLLPAAGKTYKNTYPISCDSLWPTVKATLANPDNYAKVDIDDAKQTADYAPKHSVHFDISGVLLQRMNHVTLVPRGTGCQMQVVSNYSGWGHEDQGDFKKRVDEALARPRTEPKSEPPVPAEKPSAN